MLKLRFLRNSATLDVTNNSLETVMFHLQEMLGIFDLRSIGYYNINHVFLQQNVSKHFRVESADVLYKQFGKFVKP